MQQPLDGWSLTSPHCPHIGTEHEAGATRCTGCVGDGEAGEGNAHGCLASLFSAGTAVQNRIVFPSSVLFSTHIVGFTSERASTSSQLHGESGGGGGDGGDGSGGPDLGGLDGGERVHSRQPLQLGSVHSQRDSHEV